MNPDSSILSVHHIGGRAGSRGFPIIPNIFEGDLENVYYDADADCIEQIEDRLQVFSRKIALPYCIDGVNGTKKFYLTADRYESTLTRPEPTGDFLHNPTLGWDQDLQGDVDEIRDVAVVTLDHIFQQPNAPAQAPDFLSLDTEGTEPQILAGAEALLRCDVIGLQTEFHLEHTFGPINQILTGHGYQLADVKIFETPFRYPEQIPIGLRGVMGTGPQLGEVLYLKDPGVILQQHREPWLDLLKGAFFAFLHGKLPMMYAYLKSLDGLEGAGAQWKQNASRRKYLEFLEAFAHCMKTYPFIVPLRFSTIFHDAHIRAKRFLKQYSAPTGKELHQRYFQYVDLATFKAGAPELFKEDYIALEKVCHRFGFKETADLLKQNRLCDIIMLLMKLGLVTKNEDAWQLTLNDLQAL